jgi:hypothetical protein
VQARAGSVADLIVKLNSAQPLRLVLTQADFEIFPGQQVTDVAHVRVAAPLRFTGWTLLERFGVLRDAELGEGLIHAGAQTTLSGPRVNGDAVVGELSVGGAMAESVRVPCSKLTTAPAPGPEPELLLGTALVRPTDAWLVLSATPASPITLRVRNLMALSKLEERDAWVRLSASYTDGSRVAGWAQASTVEAIPTGEEPVPATSGPGFCGDGCGGGASDYEIGPAQLLPDTQVHAAPDGEVWADVPLPLRVTIAHRGNEPWVRLLKIPGIEENRGCHSLEHAWVPRERVKFGVE